MGTWEKSAILVGLLYVVTGILASVAYDFWIEPYLQKRFNNGGVQSQ